MEGNKDGYEDMTSLFLPDISHQNPRRRENNPPSETHETSQSSSNSKSNLGTPFPLNSGNNSQSNFANFLNNNDFITWKVPNDFNNQIYSSGATTPGVQNNASDPSNLASSMLNPSTTNNTDTVEAHGHLSHYSSYVPLEALPHHRLHPHPHGPSQLFPSSNVQPPSFQKPMDGNWLGNLNGFDMDRALNDNKNMNQGLYYSDLMDQNTMLVQQLQQQLQQSHQMPTSQFMPQQGQLLSDSLNVTNASGYPNNVQEGDYSAAHRSMVPDEGTKRTEKRKRNYVTKAKNKPKASQIAIDYAPEKLTKLLDLKCKRLNNDCKLTDQKGNEIKVDFQGFLNGRVLTNDLDNGTYIFSILEDRVNDKGFKNTIIKSDPKVISCYRRNFMQVSLNFNLSGFVNYSEGEPKILKLQTSEYGYHISRVVKWFKIEISAVSNNASTGTVPLIITEDIKDKKDEPTSTHSSHSDSVTPQPVNTNEQVVTINNATINDGKIENFFIVKKLQFKSATPNNGNLTFQNYYYLKIKLSAIVADLYFDDYIDEEFAATSTDTSRNEIQLFELESEPITVRGRNPSFYAERKDILVKGRSSTFRKSYDMASKSDDGASYVDSILSQLTPIKNANENDEPADEVAEEDRDNDLESKSENEHQLGHERDQVLKDGSLEPDKNQEDESFDESDDPPQKKSSTGSPVMPVSYSPKKGLPPVIYNNNSSIDMDAMLRNIQSKGNQHYKYFPISNVYYLPPVNVVYFPHGAHQQMEKVKNSSPAVEERNVIRRKSSNVYFR